jgi:DNA-binding response OmpR family regulator
MDDENGIILLAEDSRDDEEFFRRALQRNGIKNPMHAVQFGEEAIKYLAGEGQYADRAKFPLPKLVVLDSKMPGKSGWDVLRWVSERAEFSNLPVLILGGVGTPTEAEMAVRLGAVGYYPKPATPAELERLVAEIGRKWLLPPPTSAAA